MVGFALSAGLLEPLRQRLRIWDFAACGGGSDALAGNAPDQALSTVEAVRSALESVQALRELLSERVIYASARASPLMILGPAHNEPDRLSWTVSQGNCVINAPLMIPSLDSTIRYWAVPCSNVAS